MDIFVIIGGTQGLGRACAEQGTTDHNWILLYDLSLHFDCPLSPCVEYITKKQPESVVIITGRKPEVPANLGSKMVYAKERY